MQSTWKVPRSLPARLNMRSARPGAGISVSAGSAAVASATCTAKGTRKYQVIAMAEERSYGMSEVDIQEIGSDVPVADSCLCKDGITVAGGR